MEAWHLTRRFFASLRASRPTSSEEDWLLALLTSPEQALYRAQDDVDRRHSIDCALRIRDALGAHATGPVVVASALHDVGKAGTDLGTPGRVLATLLGKSLPTRTIDAWSELDGRRGKLCRYVRHDERGADMLVGAGSHPTVVAWAREHHNRGIWSLETDTAEALWAADR